MNELHEEAAVESSGEVARATPQSERRRRRSGVVMNSEVGTAASVKVVQVLEFDEVGKISSIRAYKA